MKELKFATYILLVLIFTGVNCLIVHQHTTYDASFICCPDGYVFNSDTLSCVCPPSTPYIDAAGRCVACDSVWNNSTLKCINCISPAIYNSTTNSCSCPETLPFLT